ncbi:hypothetical protein [Kitasatospora cathayae]|uniref:Uncharacterized protein n=1 Tax=Kitasatospora cathayae TaxID=3004092 RepID=A0ABY7PXK5_9ACTN|nr:hypothetical protein [Kitasatospora sp. HUAS 3-15]WBP84924.1 hypothetical protein O1G21_03030 [Kitasatospora sp. HUAS 3-15]
MADLHNQPEPEGPGHRERGMRRVFTATRWTVAAAAAGSAALGLTYVSLAPGVTGAPAPASAPTRSMLPAEVTCTQQPAAPAPANTPPRGDKEQGRDDYEELAAPALSAATPQSTVTCTTLSPPAQAPAPTHQMPQTRTGAS